jgi:hypothetical protein
VWNYFVDCRRARAFIPDLERLVALVAEQSQARRFSEVPGPRAVSGATGFTTTSSRPRFFASGAGLATASSPFSVKRAPC